MHHSLWLICLCLVLVSSQNCNILDNTDYSSSDPSLVTLYNVPSVQACCSACAEFEDCAYYSWNKNAGSALFQQCIIRDKNSQAIVNTDTQGGVNKGALYQFQYQCSNEQNGVDYNNGYLQDITNVGSSSACCTLCGNYTGCNYWVFASSTKNCFLKATNTNKVASTGTTAGSVLVPAAPMRTGSKRGIAWFNSLSCSDLKLMNGVTWIYNWAYQPDALLLKCINSLGLEYIPMIWGLPVTLGSVYNNSKYLLTFNEPNFNDQSNILPATAATYWPQIEQFARQNNMKIASPAAATGGYMDPIAWFDQFFAACVGCQIDFIATHIYTCSPEGVYNFLVSLKKYGKPIWLTEFACPAVGQPASVEYAFMNQTMAYLDADKDIERYAWYGTRIPPSDTWLGPTANLFSSSDCSLSDIGKLYNSDAASIKPSTGGSGGSGGSGSSSTSSVVCNLLLVSLLIVMQWML